MKNTIYKINLNGHIYEYSTHELAEHFDKSTTWIYDRRRECVELNIPEEKMVQYMQEYNEGHHRIKGNNLSDGKDTRETKQKRLRRKFPEIFHLALYEQW